MPLLQIARALVARGHDMTTVMAIRFCAPAQSTGATAVDLRGAADFDDRALTKLYPERAVPGPEATNVDWRIFLGGMEEQHRVLQELLANRPNAAPIANALLLGTCPTRLGAPRRAVRRWLSVGVVPVALGDPEPWPPPSWWSELVE